MHLGYISAVVASKDGWCSVKKQLYLFAESDINLFQKRVDRLLITRLTFEHFGLYFCR